MPCYTGAHHERSMIVISFTSRECYTSDCGLFTTEVYCLSFSNFYRCRGERDMDKFVDDELKRLHKSELNLAAVKSIAAFMM
ncbi:MULTISPECIES: hypothetical protein [unclassified Polaribacter]|uniref:hypothetical protein n=1 Tax=unclassified Polaribacter TaxID=196858 RepID=UPI0011BE54D2|nr:MULTISPECIES: hypothetical protein [unclassified Polaribacter]TXD52110.1 hypothetical protein ES043_09105 [Polaribacter sp. IC063]TXD59964.1 hypothetical protein ES044_08595 [Polaribacter sp. IC066]